MTRGQRSSTATEDGQSKQQPPKPATQSKNDLLEDILGGNPDFADRFFGEAPATRPRPRSASASADADADGDVQMSASANDVSHPRSHRKNSKSSTSTNNNRSTTQPQMAHSNGESAITFENTPQDIDMLVLLQIHEDVESYRYDLAFCMAQLDPGNIDNITAAEQRTFQLRILDLGHQMRMLQHRAQLMQAGMINARHPGMVGTAGMATANAHWGLYPPAGGGLAAAPSHGYGGGGYGGAGTFALPGQPMLAPRPPFFSHEPPQERRGPGRPPGSKNRGKPPFDPSQPQDTPTPGGPSGSAKAAALASAGAKRDRPKEIRVATPNGSGPAEEPASSDTAQPKPSKRPRVDVRVGSPLSNATDDGSGTTAPQSNIFLANYKGPSHPENHDDDDDTETEPNANGSGSPAANGRKALPRTIAVSSSTPAPGRSLADSPSTASPAPSSGPRGESFQRLGHWQCTLCTSQKYLQAPPPKTPAEPSSWPLRDVSKIVTHFTRMHGEHNDMERCIELGAALEANIGPFRYWCQVTKKERGTDEAQIQDTLSQLKAGTLPPLLRKHSTAAAKFPHPA